MADILDINLINWRIDEELAKAKAKYGPRHFDIIVLEGCRGNMISNPDLLDALRHLKLNGSAYTAS